MIVFMKKFTLSLYLFIILISASPGQEVKITSSFDSPKINIGDQIKYTITVEKPAGFSLHLPVLKDTICKNIDIISGPKTDSTQTKDGRVKVIQKYLVTSFDSGRYEVRPFYAEAISQGGLKRYYSDYSLLEVTRINIAPADSTKKIYDIVAPYKAPLTLGEILPWVLLIIIAGVAVWFAVRYIKNYKRSVKGEEIFIPKEPAHVIALRELENLKAAELWQQGEIKKYYTRLTEILRQYLENRYSVYSLELTTGETLEALVKSGFKKNGSYNDLKSVLTGADLVKFAKYNPIPSENESHFQTSWNFVLATKETEVAAEERVEKNSGKEGVA